MLRAGFAALAALAVMAAPYSGGGSGTPPVPPPAPVLVDEPEAAPPLAPLPRRPRAPGAERAGLLRPMPTPRPSARVRELVLTFDDGPDLLGTPAVLAELERRGLKAIFFVNGEHMVGDRPEDFARRDLVRKIAAQGHLVANHTLSHKNVCRLDPESMEREIDGNSEIISAATGVRPLLFRSPYGARCRRLDQALRERELLQVGWNLDPQEWKSGDAGSEEGIVRYVTHRLSRFGGRLILLLHDTKRDAVRALPHILDWVARENHRLARNGGTPIQIRDYSVFLPVEPLPDTGFEPFFADFTNAAGALSSLPKLAPRF